MIHKLLLIITLFGFTFNLLAPGQARVLAPHQDEAEALKLVLRYYKSQDRNPVMDSVETDSAEAATLSPNQHRIDIDSKSGVTDSSASTIDDEIQSDFQAATTSLPDPEELEDETTTLFPVEKMEEMGAIPLTSHSKESNDQDLKPLSDESESEASSISVHPTETLNDEKAPEITSSPAQSSSPLPESTSASPISPSTTEGVVVREEEKPSPSTTTVAPAVVTVEEGTPSSSSSTAAPAIVTVADEKPSSSSTAAPAVVTVAEEKPSSSTEAPEIVAREEEKPFASSSSTVAPEVVVAPECSEGDVRQDSCNTCICIGGKFLCSKRACPLLSSNQVKTIQKKPEPSSASIEIENNNSLLVRSNLTEQVSEEIGSIPTTIPTTTTTTTTTPKPECYSGLTKSIDCNLCICSPTQKWACTKHSCIALTLREKASYSDGSFMNKTETLVENPNIDEDCSEGEVMNWGCNSCVCFMNSWSCTDQKCPPTTVAPRPEEMHEACNTEEDIKSIDCNVCHCQRGVWECSTNDCKKFGHRNQIPTRNKFRFRSSSKN